MFPNIIRLNIDSVNDESELKLTDIQCNMDSEIIVKADEYNVSIEKCEVPITHMPLDVGKDFNIMIDWQPEDFSTHPKLIRGYNNFTIPGTYYSVLELIESVNKIIHDDLMPQISFGRFDYNNETKMISFRFDNSKREVIDIDGIHLWLDPRLVYLMNSIPKLFQKNVINGMNEVLLKTFAGPVDPDKPDNVVIRTQTRYTINRFFGFKSIRIFSTLPTVSYFIFDQDTSSLVRSNLLTEVILNSETYQEGQTNLIYIPTFNKLTELTGQDMVKDFRVWFYIHYKNGTDYALRFSQGEYLSLTMSFQTK